MQEKGIISTNQMVWMLFILITSVSAIQIPGLLIMQAGRDAWLSVIGGWFMDVLLALVYGYMGIRFPGQNFVQYSITILGKYLGRIVGILFPLFFLLVSTLLMRGLSQLINIFFLPRTPFEVIVIAGFLVVAYAARSGIEVIARVTEVLGPLYILSTLILGLLISPYAEFGRLKPQFDQGVYPFLIGSPFILTFFGICIMMAMFIPLCNRPENGFLAKFIAVSLGALFLEIIVILGIAVFGYEQAKNMYAPGLELTRMINIARFLERLEIVWMMIATGAGVIASACMIWAFSLGIAQIVGLSTYKPLVYPGALVALMLGLTAFTSNMEQMSFVTYSYPVAAVFVEAGLEILLFILALVLNKRGNTA